MRNHLGAREFPITPVQAPFSDEMVLGVTALRRRPSEPASAHLGWLDSLQATLVGPTPPPPTPSIQYVAVNLTVV